jgi:hypothetical protein
LGLKNVDPKWHVDDLNPSAGPVRDLKLTCKHSVTPSCESFILFSGSLSSAAKIDDLLVAGVVDDSAKSMRTRRWGWVQFLAAGLSVQLRACEEKRKGGEREQEGFFPRLWSCDNYGAGYLPTMSITDVYDTSIIDQP